jgi:hypothetical protein
MAENEEGIEPRKRGRKTKKGELPDNAQVAAAMTAWASEQRLARGVGGDFYVEDEGGKYGSASVGVPFPALCLEHLYQSSVYPLGRSEMVAGTQGSNKSSYLYEHYRWFTWPLGGYGFHMENESKEEEFPPLMASMLDYDLSHMPGPFFSESMNDWQAQIIDFTADGKRSFKALFEPLGLHKRVPLILGVDSYFAKLAEESIKSIIEEKNVAREFSWEAQKVSRFLKAIFQQVKHYPLAIVGTNHSKPSIDPRSGRTLDNITGGYALRFQDTFEVIMKKIGYDRRADHTYNEILFETIKNSIGRDHVTIKAEIKFCDIDSVTGRQRVYWDWDSATVNMLLGKDRSPGDKHFGGVPSKLKEAADITGLREATAGRCYSEILGVPRDNPIPREEMGKMINNNEALKEQLRPLLGVRKHRLFEAGILYSRQAGLAGDDDDV